MTLIQDELTVRACIEKTSENSLLCASHHAPTRAGCHNHAPPRIPTYYHAFQATTDQTSLSCQPEWLVVGYGVGLHCRGLTYCSLW